jgi:hypothetical protein
MYWNKWKVWTDLYLSNESKMRSDWFSNLVHNSLKNRNKTSLKTGKKKEPKKLLEHVEQPVGQLGVGRPHTFTSNLHKQPMSRSISMKMNCLESIQS